MDAAGREGSSWAMTEMSREKDTLLCYIRRLEVMTEEEYQQFLLLKLEQIRLGKGYHWGGVAEDRRCFYLGPST